MVSSAYLKIRGQDDADFCLINELNVKCNIISLSSWIRLAQFVLVNSALYTDFVNETQEIKVMVNVKN